jgi:hypothetical protein
MLICVLGDQASLQQKLNAYKLFVGLLENILSNHSYERDAIQGIINLINQNTK